MKLLEEATVVCDDIETVADCCCVDPDDNS